MDEWIKYVEPQNVDNTGDMPEYYLHVATGVLYCERSTYRDDASVHNSEDGGPLAWLARHHYTRDVPPMGAIAGRDLTMREWQHYVTDKPATERDMDEYYLHVPSGTLYMDPERNTPRSAHNLHPEGVLTWLRTMGYRLDHDPRITLPVGI